MTQSTTRLKSLKDRSSRTQVLSIVELINHLVAY